MIAALLRFFNRAAARRAYRKGLRDGIQQGRDAEWADQFFARIRADKVARDRLGRWIPKDRRPHA